MESLTRLDDLREALIALDEGRIGATDVERLTKDALSTGVLSSDQALQELQNAGNRRASARIIAGLQLEDGAPWERIASLLAGRTDSVGQSPLTRFPGSEPQPSVRKPQTSDGDRRWVDPDPHSARMDAADMIGRVLGSRYRLDRELDSGVIGTVYLGADLQANEAPYAVTLLRPEFRSFSEALALLRTEVRVTRMLRHPHIARVYSLNSDRLGVYLVTEYLEGRTLEARLREMGTGLPLNEACRVVADVCAALAYAHDLDVVHGDLQPANVFMTPSGRSKLLNVGLARAAGTRNGRFDPRRLGSQILAYASPEMLEGRAPDPRDDVYSLGCIIYLALSGVHPFESRATIEAREPGLGMTPLQSLSRGQNAALAHALAFERDQRTPTVTELLAALGWAADPHVADTPAVLPVPEAAAPTPISSLRAASTESPRLPSPRASRRYLAPALILLTLLLVAAGIGIFLYQQSLSPRVTLRSRPAVTPPPVAVPTASPIPPSSPPAAAPASAPAAVNSAPTAAPAAAAEKTAPGAVIPLLRPVPKAEAAMANSDNCPYPPEAVDQGLTGTVILLVYVTPGGKSTTTKLARTSGSSVLDEAALRCVEQFGQFPPPPEGTASGYWGRVRFKWSFGT